MMKTYIVDSFTDTPFRGNPAGVCLDAGALSPERMLAIAAELNFSETAFVQHIEEEKYSIRYFSPKMEIPLCGHATLAAAKVLFANTDLEKIVFSTVEEKVLYIRRMGEYIQMEFPLYTTTAARAPEALLKALGIPSITNSGYNDETRILMLEIDSTAELRMLKPNFAALLESHDSINGVLVTARSKDGLYDFHSRYFWPWSGTNEDPVTGGTHTFLAPYWAKRFGKNVLKSFQSSQRTGFMEVEITAQNTVLIRGEAVLVLEGNLLVE